MLPWWVFAIGSAIFVAVSMIVRKKVLFKEHAMQYEAVNKLFLFLLMLLFIPYVKLDFSLGLLGLMVLIGIVGSIAGIYMAKAYRHMDLSEVAPLKNLSPAILVVLAYFILREQPGYAHLGGIALLLIGAYVLEADHSLTDFRAPFEKIWKSKYIHYVFAVLVVWAFVAIGHKYLLGFVDPITLLFFVMLFTSITTITAIHVRHRGIEDIKEGIKLYGWAIFLTALLQIAASLAIFKAMSMAYVSLVIPIKRLSTFFTTVVGGEIFHEKRILIKGIACVIMIAGAYLIIV